MLFCGIFVIFLILNKSLAQNYCDPALCDPGRQHIACNNNGRWASGCNGRILDPGPYINLILDLHNERRDQIASGGMSRFPSAQRMAAMSWDSELARVAVFNALRCQMQHDQCRNTVAFRYAGQNLSILFTRSIDISEFLRQRIESWWSEHQSATRSDVEKYRSRSGPPIGHFTVMANEKNDRVGCAIAQYTDSSRRDATYLVCNYAVTNMLNNPVYSFGGAPASACETGRHSEYANLCSDREVYQHNVWAG